MHKAIMIFKVNKRRLLTLSLLGVFLFQLAARAPTVDAQGDVSDRKKVLVLHSYHHGFKWTDELQEGIAAVLDADPLDVEIQIEYMDSKRIADETYYRQLYEIYKHKFSQRQFDVIISSDNNAFDFLLQHRDEIFPETPVVFSGVNFFHQAQLGGQRLFTGVNEDADLRANIELILKLHPNIRQIVVVNDTTTTGQVIHKKLAEIMGDFQDRVQFTLLEDVDMSQVRERVRALPDDSIVYYTLFFRDKSGQFFEYDESISLITEVSSVPVYGTWDFSLEYGIVGGMLTSGYSQGEAAAKIALRILNGESTTDVPVLMQSPNRYMFDHDQLKKWNISTANLPADSTIINRPVTFISRYRAWLWAAAIVVLGLTLAIIVLGANILRRRRAESALRVSNEELQAIRASLEQRVAERTAELEKTLSRLATRSKQLEDAIRQQEKAVRQSERRAGLLQASAEVSRAAAQIRDLDQLLSEVTRLISQHFGFYHAGVFLIDEDGRYAVLRAANSEGGRHMLARRHQLGVDSEGIVGYVTGTGRPRIALDVGEDAVFFKNPDLPDTRSEMALPLCIGDEVIGALDVQSTEEAAFASEDVAVLTSLADQVSIAIQNARLFQQTQAALAEAEEVHRRYLRQEWDSFLGGRPATRPRQSAQTGRRP